MLLAKLNRIDSRIYLRCSWIIATKQAVSNNRTIRNNKLNVAERVFLHRIVTTIRLTLIFLFLFSLLACASPEKKTLRYVGDKSIYPAVAYVFDLLSAKFIKADVLNNEYISSYIRYTGWGRINRFRIYVSIRDQVITTEIADVQIQVRRGGFVSWEADSVSSLVDTDEYMLKINKKIIKAIKKPTQSEPTKQKVLGDLDFNRIVLKDLSPEHGQIWVRKNMKNREYRFNSKIERILIAKEKKKYGKYLVKMSSQNIDIKSKILLKFYSNDTLYTRLHIGDEVEVVGLLEEAEYSYQKDALSVVFSDIQNK